MRLPLMTHLCNKAVERYNNTKDANDQMICQIEDRINALASKPENQKITSVLAANKRLSHNGAGRIYVQLFV
jgi:hypothetical protein